MKIWKKAVSAGLACCMMLGLTTMNAWALEPKKITSVSLDIASNIVVGDTVKKEAVTITSKGERYYVKDYRFLNAVQTWEQSETPQIEIRLGAAENNYFSLSGIKDVRLFGDRAYGDSVTPQEDMTEVLVTIKLEPLANSLGAVPSARWCSTGFASWGKAYGADGYEIRVYHDGSVQGSVEQVSMLYFDLSSKMTRAGNYYFEVRPINDTRLNKKGDWVASETILVSAKTAERFKEGGLPLGWLFDGSGWKYRMNNSKWAKDQWCQDGQTWYHFNENAYMETGWIQVDGKWYYCTSNGDMLANTVTPDGYTVGADGAWIQ